MSQDRTEQEYHLTPNGWVAGSFYVYGNKTEDVPTPADRIETWIEKIDDSSGRAPEVISWSMVWRSESASEEVSELHKKFPRPEHQPRQISPKRKRRPVYP